MVKQRIRNYTYSFLSAAKHRINGGVLLMFVAVLAMVIANSPFSSYYQEFWNHPVTLSIGEFNLFSHHGRPMTLLEFINDALMTLFFFSVGLEVKREIMVGELSSFKQAILPIITAFGGMIIPCLVYFMIAHESPESRGMAMPMATDLAFVLGILSLFGKRVPISLKVFLTAFAVVDDIGGILIIALFYSSSISINFLLLAALGLVLLFIANRMSVMHRIVYIILGIFVWYCFSQSGIHATIAGVIVAFLIPARPCINVQHYIDRIRETIKGFPITKEDADENIDKIVLNKTQIDELKSIQAASHRVISPLQAFENSTHGWVNYFIIPLFAFANAGIELTGGFSPNFGLVTIAVFVGLIVGKCIGVFSFTFFAVKTKFVELPDGMNWKNLFALSILGGIGFTVSIFIAGLSFSDEHPELLLQAKFGILLATIVAGVLGWTILNFVLPKKSEVEDNE